MQNNIETPNKSSEQYINNFIDSIPSTVTLKVSKETLRKWMIEIVEKYKENSESQPETIDSMSYYSDDVRYAVYFYKGSWITVCVQDFDFNDYWQENFIYEEGYDEDPDMNALQFERRDVAYMDNRYIYDNDELAKALASIVANNIESVEQRLIYE